MTPAHLTDGLRTTLTQYVLGVLEPEEAQVVAAHLATGCALCTTEIQSMVQVIALFGYCTPAVPPPPLLRTQLFARLTAFGREMPVGP